MITNDPDTWPSGNKVWDICNAVATAEGANVAGSNPDRLNNPGDISDGALTYGSQFHSGSNITTFPDKETGWTWLYNKWQNIVSGNSTVYHPSDTWSVIGKKWAGDSGPWTANVTNYLGVDPGSTVADYVNGGPRLTPGG